MKAKLSINEMGGWELNLTAENEIEVMMIESVNCGVGVKVEAYIAREDTESTVLIISGENKKYVKTFTDKTGAA